MEMMRMTELASTVAQLECSLDTESARRSALQVALARAKGDLQAAQADREVRLPRRVTEGLS